MYLSRLEIQGFKSFAQHVVLHFDSGISAIVGPNGCGKTNIVDAIRWVLGEQRYSALRSEKMEDVIFNGTKTRKPLGMAEASLVIENTKGILPSEYTQVTVGRRIYRSGESEYLFEWRFLQAQRHSGSLYGHRDGRRCVLGDRTEDDRNHPERSHRRAPPPV